MLASYPVIAILMGGALAYAVATLTASLISRLGFPLPPVAKRIGCIDGLRGYLALSVLVHHFIIWMQVTRLGRGWTPPEVALFNELGAGGVALFFMTTGLLFYPRILTGFRSCSWPSVYTSRFFRIVPLVAVSVAVVIAIILIRTGGGLGGDVFPPALRWISASGEPPLLGYEESGRLNAYVFWSLKYEWIFYLFLLPACSLGMDLLGDRHRSWVFPVLLLVGSLAATVVGVPGSTWRYMPLFAIGMIAYECQRRENIAAMLRTRTATTAAAVALIAAMTLFSVPYTYALPLFGFFFICVACGNSMGGLFRSKAALVLGECSYGIYLLHGIVLSLLFVDAEILTRIFSTNELPILLPVAAAVVTLLTSVTYLLVERPGILVGARLSKQLSGFRLRNELPKVKMAS